MSDLTSLGHLIRPNKIGPVYLSLLTIGLVIAAVAVHQQTMSGAASTGAVGAKLTLAQLGVAITATIDALCWLAAIISLARDTFLGIKQARALKRQQADDARVRMETLRRDLQQLYQTHHQALVEQVRLLLQPDRYGRRDTVGASKEFSLFQDEVAAPGLRRQGYNEADIARVFAAEQETLLAGVIRDI